MLTEGMSTVFPDWVPSIGIPIAALAGVVFAVMLRH